MSSAVDQKSSSSSSSTAAASAKISAGLELLKTMEASGKNESISRETILPLLPDFIRLEFEKAATTPFKNDIEYYAQIEAILYLKLVGWYMHNGISDMVFSAQSDQYADVGYIQLVKGREVAAVITSLHKELDSNRKQRISFTASAASDSSESIILPRIERLMLKLNASAVERELFEMVFFYGTSEIVSREWYNPNGFNARTGGQFNMQTVSRVLGVDMLEVIKFVSANSTWVKESIVTAVNSPKGEFGIAYELNANQLALMGFPLNATQYLQIDSQLIQELLHQEPSFKDSPAGKAGNDLKLGSGLSRQNSVNSDSEDNATEKEKFSNMESLFSLLRKEEVDPSLSPIDDENGAAAGGGNGLDLAAEERSSRSFDDADAVADEGDLLADELAVAIDSASADKASKEEKEGVGGGVGKDSGEADIDLTPYKNDLSYLQDQIQLTNLVAKISANTRSINEMGEYDDDDDKQVGGYSYGNEMYDPNTGRLLPKEQIIQKKQNSLRKIKTKERVLRGKITRRLYAVKAESGSSKTGWYPRLERLVSALSLSPFEKNVILYLIGTVVSPRSSLYTNGQKCKCSVNDLLQAFCSSLEESMNFRKYFYKNSILVKEGILNMMGQDFMSDLTDCHVEIDRRMLDFVVGLDTEFSEIVDGSHLYTPTIDVQDVILPEDVKNVIMTTTMNFDRLKQVEKDMEVDKKISYGRGMALLFYGASGTGKTMLANAIAASLKKKVLLINFPTLGDNSSGMIIKMIFREAKIHNAVIFFDECESLFMSRELGYRNVNMILTELEKYDGLSILATNRPSDLDEAMHRRINLSVEFRKPDHILREKIWRTLQSAKIPLAADVNIPELALKYELTGGFIKNTWLAALAFAVARDNDSPIVCQADLIKAASHQLRGRLSMVDFDRRIIPTRGLDDVILSPDLKESLQNIVDFGKAQSILFSQWGFNKQHGTSKGIGALFTGPPGTGKTMAAEAIGYDLGRPLKVVNCAQLISKWVGESAKNIQAVFDEAKAVDAILVFDEAESLFGERSHGGADGGSRHDMMNVGVLLHHIETFSGVVIVITNIKDMIDQAFFRRFKFVLDFKPPSAVERLRLWKLLIPAEAPLSPTVDLQALAQRFEFAGGNIKTAVFRAASRAALRSNPAERVITMEDLRKAAEEEAGKDSKSVVSTMYM